MISRLFSKKHSIDSSSPTGVYLAYLRKALTLAATYRSIGEIATSIGMRQYEEHSEGDTIRVADLITAEWKKLYDAVQLIEETDPPMDVLLPLHMHARAYLRGLLKFHDELNLSLINALQGKDREAEYHKDSAGGWYRSTAGILPSLDLALEQLRRKQRNLYNALALQPDIVKKLEAKLSGEA